MEICRELCDFLGIYGCVYVYIYIYIYIYRGYLGLWGYIGKRKLKGKMEKETEAGLP